MSTHILSLPFAVSILTFRFYNPLTERLCGDGKQGLKQVLKQGLKQANKQGKKF